MKSQEFFTITSYEKIKVNKIRVLEKNFEKKKFLSKIVYHCIQS